MNWVHFPLHPETPTDGMLIEDLFAGRDFDLDAMYARMKSLMDDEGLEYGQRTHTYNSRLSQELGKWAETQSGGEAIHDAMFKAYFVDGVNVGDVDVLVEIAASVGLDADQARQVVEQRTFESQINEDWAKSRQYGVTGVPTFVAGGYGVVGAQSYETLVKLVEQAAGETTLKTSRDPIVANSSTSKSRD